jgi:hypothetical protein
MTGIVKFSQAGLPAVSTLSTALRSIDNDVGAVGQAILKMDKTGHWVFGADQTEVEDGSEWAVNPFSFVHGYIAWGDGEVLGETMVSVAQPLPEPQPAPPQARKGWEKQVGLGLKCLSGEDTGLDVRYTTTSVGGKRSVQSLAVAIAEQVEKDPSKPVPIVRLGKEHYQHKSYGRIFTPVFEVVRWASMDGDAPAAPGPLEDEAPAPAAAPAGRRRRVG